MGIGVRGLSGTPYHIFPTENMDSRRIDLGTRYRFTPVSTLWGKWTTGTERVRDGEHSSQGDFQITNKTRSNAKEPDLASLRREFDFSRKLT